MELQRVSEIRMSKIWMSKIRMSKIRKMPNSGSNFAQPKLLKSKLSYTILIFFIKRSRLARRVSDTWVYKESDTWVYKESEHLTGSSCLKS